MTSRTCPTRPTGGGSSSTRSRSRRRPAGASPLGIFGGGRAFWVQDSGGAPRRPQRQGLGLRRARRALRRCSCVEQHDHRRLRRHERPLRHGGLLVGTGPGGETDPEALVRQPDGYWFRGNHWEHRHVSAVLLVKQLHPAFVGDQQHTIWEHPDPQWPVPTLPIWRRSTLGADGRLGFVEPERNQAEWFGLSRPWPIGEPFPRRRPDLR